MKTQDKEEIKWISVNLLSNKIQYPAKKYGNYIVARFSNYGDILIDKRNLKALVLTIDRPYVVAENFEEWLKRGFVVITLFHKRLADGSYYQAESSNQNKRYILNAKDGSMVCAGYILSDYTYEFLRGKTDYFILRNTQKKSAIFDKNGKQISDWFDIIYVDGLVEGASDYYVAKKDNKKTIFHKDGYQVTDWFDDVSYFGLVQGQSDYYIARKNGKEAIFHKSGKQITDWYDSVDAYGLALGQSDYYIAGKNYKEAIFHKDGKQVTDWYDQIYSGGLVDGGSDYYKVEKDGKEAVFHKDGKQITVWYNRVYASNLVRGNSVYYIAVKNGKEAIFHKSGRQISDWFDWIDSYGLVQGQSDYYIADNNDKKAIFDKNGSQISDWFDDIMRYGLVHGESDYYIVFVRDAKKKRTKKETMYIGKLGSPKLLGPLKDFVSWSQLGFISDPSSTSIAVYTLDDKRLDISKQEADEFFKEGEKDYEQTK
jgi:hypothetical protein